MIVGAFTASGKSERKNVTMLSGWIILLAGIPAALSSSIFQHILLFDKTIFDATDFLVSNIMLPLGNLFIPIFIIHKMNQTLVKEEFLRNSSLAPGVYTTWRKIMMWIAPATIVIVLLNTIGFI